MRYDQLSPVPPLTRVTRAIIIVNCVMFFVRFTLIHLFDFHIHDLTLDHILGLVPAAVAQKGWVWQLVTYMFLHGNPLHLLLNMLILWYFGAEIEMRLGEKQFLFYFFLCGIGGGIVNLLVNLAFVSPEQLSSPIIGASGAIFGILAAYGMFFGNRYFLVLFLFPLKAKYFVLIIALLELITGVENSPADNVAHFAHLGGMAVGALYIYLRYFSGKGRGNSNKKDAERERLKKQFTLIVNPKPGEGADEKGGGGGPYWN